MIKLSWGVRIAILYTGFVVLVIAMVIFASTRKTDLVSDNYYSQELKFQDQIDKQKRTGELSEQVIIENSDGFITVKFPASAIMKDISGFIYFYRPSNENSDFKMNINTDENGGQKIPVSKLLKGWWQIKISWTSGGTEYYNESRVKIE